MVKSHAPAQPDPEQVFRRGGLLVLLLALALVALSAAELAYRLGQPTDGWFISTSPDDEILLDVNRLGAPTPLQPGDIRESPKFLDFSY
jgi:hypothetical protein